MKFRKDILTDNRGFSYPTKATKHATPVSETGNAPCMILFKLNCHATVCQEGNSLIFGTEEHTCTAEPGIDNTLHIKKKSSLPHTVTFHNLQLKLLTRS